MRLPRDKRTPPSSIKSFEIVSPDDPILWKGDPEADKKAVEKRKRSRTAFKIFGILAVLVSVGLTAHQMWRASDGSAPLTESVSSEVTNQTAPAAPSIFDGQLPRDTQIRLAPASEMPSSLYASSLDTIRLTLEQGNTAEAEAKLKALPKEALSDRRAQQFAGVLWNNLGVKYRTTTGTDAGKAAFKAAIAVDPMQPEAHRNLTRLYMELKDPALTREFLEKTISLAPDDPWFHLALAEMLYNKNDFGGTSTHLDQAAELVGRYPEVQAYVKLISAKLKAAQKSEQTLLNRQSSHFQVKFEGGDDYEIWGRVLEILEEAYRDIGQQLGHYPSKPITVVLLTRESFHSTTGGPAWSDGLFDPVLGRIKIPTQGALTDQAWLTRTLRHEFVHALLHDRVGGRMGAIPTWLNEGLAMQLAGDPMPDIPELMRGEVQLIPLSYLEGTWSAFPAKVATVAYLEGNSATVYLIDRFSMEKVRELISVLAAGQPIAAAMQDRLFFPYDEFQRRWIDNLNEKLRARKT
jgi:tetratricopeptide (TPR) repeat protein